MISEGEPSSTVGRPQRRMAVAIGMNVGVSSPDRSTSGNHFFATASTHFSRMKRMWSKITTASSAFSAIHNAGMVLLKIWAFFSNFWNDIGKSRPKKLPKWFIDFIRFWSWKQFSFWARLSPKHWANFLRMVSEFLFLSSVNMKLFISCQ